MKVTELLSKEPCNQTLEGHRPSALMNKVLKTDQGLTPTVLINKHRKRGITHLNERLAELPAAARTGLLIHELLHIALNNGKGWREKGVQYHTPAFAALERHFSGLLGTEVISICDY